MVKISTMTAYKSHTKPVRAGIGRDEVSKLGNLITKQGWETSERRNLLGFKKSSAKMAETFDAHNVDSWVLASFVTGKSVGLNLIRAGSGGLMAGHCPWG